MSYRTVLLHCLIQSEMLFCMHRSVIWCLFSISFMLVTLILLIYSLLHLRLFFSAGKIRTSLAVFSRLLKGIGVWMWSCTTEIRGVLLLNECTDTSTSCCRKRYMHLPLSDLCVQYPETPSTLHCSQVQLELKENGFSQLIPQYSMQLQTHMQCRTWHLSFSCSAWQKAAGPQKRFRIWIPTHFEDWCPGQDLDHCHFLYLQI